MIESQNAAWTQDGHPVLLIWEDAFWEEKWDRNAFSFHAAEEIHFFISIPCFLSPSSSPSIFFIICSQKF